MMNQTAGTLHRTRKGDIMTAMPSTGTLSRAALQARIDALPRVRLAHLPTPLDHCPRFGRAIGAVDVWIKRDDLTGLAFGGNKTRQLEFLFADRRLHRA